MHSANRQGQDKNSHRNKATAWKLALALLFLAFLAGMASTITIAANRVTVTEADYYQRGLHYGQTASGSRNPGQDWSMSASLAQGALQVLVRDQSGAPVSGGRLSFEPKGAAGTGGAPLTLAESEPGVYRAPRPASPEGGLRGTLRFMKGEATASQKLVLFN